MTLVLVLDCKKLYMKLFLQYLMLVLDYLLQKGLLFAYVKKIISC